MYWYDIDEIAEKLEENYQDEELSDLKLTHLEELVMSLNEFDDHEVPTTKTNLEEIREAWQGLRSS